MNDTKEREQEDRELDEIRERVLASLARLDEEMEGLTRVLDDPRRLRAVSDVVDRLTNEELRALDTIIETAHTASGKKWVALVLLDDEHAQVVSSMEPIPSGDRSQSYCQMVVGAGKPWAVNNTRKNNLVNRWRSTVEYDVGAYMGVPVFARGECVGALCAFQPEAYQWKPEDEALMTRFAEDVSKALESAALREETPPETERAARIRLGLDLPTKP